MFEMIDHTTTDWIYVEQLSTFNWLFYAFRFVSFYGFKLINYFSVKNKLILATNTLLIIAAITSYWFFAKSTTLLFEFIKSILLISQWWKRFIDWIFFLYPIKGHLLTTFFGVVLSNSGEQI